MTALPWFKCYPRDFREGLAGLTPEERGAYATVLMLIYERGEAIPDDDAWIASHIWASVRVWKKIRASLIVKRRLFPVNLNGVDSLMDERAATELAKVAGVCAARSEAGKAGGKKSAEARSAKGKKRDEKSSEIRGSDFSDTKANENNALSEANASDPVKQNGSKDQADIQTLRKGSVVPPDGETTAAEAAPGDPNREAWTVAVRVLCEQGGMTEPKARAFFGKLLSAHGLEARELLAPLAEAISNQTRDPQAYLTRAAIARAKRKAGAPEKRVAWV